MCKHFSTNENLLWVATSAFSDHAFPYYAITRNKPCMQLITNSTLDHFKAFIFTSKTSKILMILIVAYPQTDVQHESMNQQRYPPLMHWQDCMGLAERCSCLHLILLWQTASGVQEASGARAPGYTAVLWLRKCLHAMQFSGSAVCQGTRHC